MGWKYSAVSWLKTFLIHRIIPVPKPTLSLYISGWRVKRKGQELNLRVFLELHECENKTIMQEISFKIHLIIKSCGVALPPLSFQLWAWPCSLYSAPFWKIIMPAVQFIKSTGKVRPEGCTEQAKGMSSQHPCGKSCEKQRTLALVFALGSLQKGRLGPSETRAARATLPTLEASSGSKILLTFFLNRKGSLLEQVIKILRWVSGIVLLTLEDWLAPLPVAEAFDRTPGPYGGILYPLRSCRRIRGGDCKVEEKHYLEGLSSMISLISNYNRVLDNTVKSQGEIPTMVQTCKDAETSIRNQGCNTSTLDLCHNKSHRAVGQIEVQIRMRRNIEIFWNTWTGSYVAFPNVKYPGPNEIKVSKANCL